MAYAILGTPKPRFDDSAGAPLVSGTLTIQNPADSLVKASYPTAADADASTNGTSGDITLDARGEPTTTQLWGKDGEDYKIIVKDSAGATVYTLDAIRLPQHSRRAAVTFTSTDATPTVAESDTFITAGTTAITDFDDGKVGDTILILAASTITITHGSPISLSLEDDYKMVAGDTLTLTMFNDQVWEEVARIRSANRTTVTFTSTDATPTIAASDTFITAGTTAITDFDDGIVGDTIKILSASSIAINHGSPVSLLGAQNFNMVSGDSLTLHMFNDQVWEEIGRSYATTTVARQQAEVVTTANTILASETGTTYFLNTAGGFSSTLPAPAGGLWYKFIVRTAPTTAYTIDTNSGDNIMYGTHLDIVGELVYSSARDILSFVANVSLQGDSCTVFSDGVSWYYEAYAGANGGITTGQT